MANDAARDLQFTATSYAASREFLTMPSSPWRSFTEIQPDREYLVQISYLPLLGYRSLPRFGKWMLAIQRQLGQTDGIIGYSLLAHTVQLNFWTMSAWRDKGALNKFFRSVPHAEAMKALRADMDSDRLNSAADLERCDEALSSAARDCRIANDAAMMSATTSARDI